MIMAVRIHGDPPRRRRRRRRRPLLPIALLLLLLLPASCLALAPPFSPTPGAGGAIAGRRRAGGSFGGAAAAAAARSPRRRPSPPAAASSRPPPPPGSAGGGGGSCDPAGAPLQGGQEAPGRSPRGRRRKKRNKYADQSQADRLEMDPLERLLAESRDKNRLLDEEQRRRRRRNLGGRFLDDGGPGPDDPAEAAADEGTTTAGGRLVAPAMRFPDNSEIDPYDPATFGYRRVGAVVSAHGVRGWVRVAAGGPRQGPAGPFASSFARQGGKGPPAASAPASPLRRWLHLKMPNKRAPRAVRLVSARRVGGGGEYLCFLEGVDTRDDALKLRGATLFVRSEEDGDDEEEETGRQQQQEGDERQEEVYSVSELVGLAVYLHGSAPRDGGDGGDGGQAPGAEAALVGTVGGVVFGDDISDLPLGYDMLEIIIAGPPGGGGAGGGEERALVPLVPELVPVVDPARGRVYVDPPAGLLDLRYVRKDKVRIRGFLPPSSST
jgi:ribosomal 30S subunit maturation factor RimM